MDASDQSCLPFGTQRSLHDLLGGGAESALGIWVCVCARAVAVAVLWRSWRRKEVAGGLLATVASSWALFYSVPGYTLLSFVSRVIMIMLAVLFVWAKAAIAQQGTAACSTDENL